MGLFYTGKGDNGKSDLGGGQSADKTTLEMSVLGNLDELNSLLGLIRSRETSEQTKQILLTAQENLFIAQANIASMMIQSKYDPPKLDYGKVEELEKLIDEFENLVEPEKGFIISGSDERSAWLDYARTVARRSERSALHLNRKKPVDKDVLAYLNRLSSILFALARVTSKESGRHEDHPKYK